MGKLGTRFKEISSRISARFNDYISQSKLSNGVSLSTQKRFMSDQIHFSVRIDSGSFDDPLDKEGIAHFLEHVITAQTDIDRSFDERGGSVGARTNANRIELYGQVQGSPENQAFVIDFLKQALVDDIDPDVFVREQKRIRNEINARNDTATGVHEQMLRHAFDTKRSYTNIGGTASQAQTYTVDDINAYKHTWMRGDNIHIAMTGALSHAELHDALEDALGCLPQHLEQPRQQHQFLPARHGEDPGHVNQLYFSFAFPEKPISVDNQYVAQLSARVLNNALRDKLIYEDGDAYETSNLHLGYSNRDGLAIISGDCLPEDGGKIVTSILNILAEQGTGDIEPHLLKRAQSRLLNDVRAWEYPITGGAHSPSGMTQEMADFGFISCVHKDKQRVEAVTMQDVQAYLQSVLSEKPAIITYGDSTEFDKALPDFYSKLYQDHGLS